MAINNGMLAHNITSIEIVGNNIFITTVGYGVYLSTNNGDT